MIDNCGEGAEEEMQVVMVVVAVVGLAEEGDGQPGRREV